VTLVVDASVAVRWLFNLPDSDRANNLFQPDSVRLVAPSLILAEIANAAWRLVTYSGADPLFAEKAVNQAERLFEELTPCADLHRQALAIALDLGHPAYDCFYLALARQYDTRVITADMRLARRCANGAYADLVEML
jgi:predicted nucleic acid-binding protein